MRIGLRQNDDAQPFPRQRTAQLEPQETIVCRYNWHSAGSLGWPFPMLKYIDTEDAVLSNSARRLLQFEITKMLIAVFREK